MMPPGLVFIDWLRPKQILYFELLYYNDTQMYPKMKNGKEIIADE